MSVGRSPAQSLLYEGFNGYTVGTMIGQATNANTLGLTGNYAENTGGTILFQSAGLSLGDLAVTGGSVTTKSPKESPAL